MSGDGIELIAMSLEKKIEARRTRLKEKEKKPVNRKALIVLFLATGLASLFFWWRGRVIRETPPVTEVKQNPGGKITPTTSQTQETQAAAIRRKMAEEKLTEELKEITATASGRYAVYVYRLSDGSSYGFNQEERMPAASIMKVPVMVTVWQKVAAGSLSPAEVYTLDEADRSTGSGPLQFKPAGSKYSIEELLTYLGKNSDNTAWVMFNRRLGKKEMQETMTKMGMTESDYGDLVITAADAARMFEYIYKGRAGGERGKGEIYGYLTDSIYEDRIPAGTAEEKNWEVLAHKVGTDAGVWSDAGILELNGEKKSDLVAVILNQEVKRAEAGTLVPDIVRRICEFEEKWSETR